MKKITNNPQRSGSPKGELDPFDRKILSALTKNARQSYAEIGAFVGLSAPAVHERVKRMTQKGIIKAVSALIDGDAVGKPFLAFVHVNSDAWAKDELTKKLLKYPEVEEMHSISGDYCLMLKVRTAGSQEMENFLSLLYHHEDILGTRSNIVLSTYIDRPVQAELTESWSSSLQ